MCSHFYLVLFEQVGYSMFLVQYRKVFSDQYNFFERVDLTFALLYVYCVLRRMGGIFLLCIEETFGLKNLKTLTQMHCSTLFLVGSQFIFKNSFVPMWALLSRFKQYLMHLFWAICIFFDCRLFSKGYHAALA